MDWQPGACPWSSRFTSPPWHDAVCLPCGAAVQITTVLDRSYSDVAAVVVWGRFDVNVASEIAGLTVYISTTALFLDSYAVACNPTNYSAPTSQRPTTYYCPRTIADARFVTVARIDNTVGNALQVRTTSRVRRTCSF